MICDSHAHFEDALSEGKLDGIIARAVSAGVTRIVAVGGSEASNSAAMEAARKYDSIISCAVGYDRHSVGDSREGAGAEIDRIIRGLQTTFRGIPRVCALGEIGLDYHYSPGTRQRQKDLFARQLELAAELSVPVIVHSRDAEADTLELLSQYAARWSGQPEQIGVVHCFTGTMDFADALLELGFSLGFSGIITFRNAGDIASVAASVPSERILVETDTPFLAPEPFRGRQNEPSFIVHIVRRLCEIRDESFERTAETTSANALRLFGPRMGAQG